MALTHTASTRSKACPALRRVRRTRSERCSISTGPAPVRESRHSSSGCRPVLTSRRSRRLPRVCFTPSRRTLWPVDSQHAMTRHGQAPARELEQWPTVHRLIVGTRRLVQRYTSCRRESVAFADCRNRRPPRPCMRCGDVSGRHVSALHPGLPTIHVNQATPHDRTPSVHIRRDPRHVPVDGVDNAVLRVHVDERLIHPSKAPRCRTRRPRFNRPPPLYSPPHPARRFALLPLAGIDI